MDNGHFYQANELGSCIRIEINDCNDPIQIIECYVENSIVLVITKSMILTQLKVVDGIMVPTRTAKLNIALNADNNVLLAPFGHLICMTSKGTIQCFDLVSDENYELRIPLVDDLGSDINRVISLAFTSSGNVLAACLQSGMCIFWNYENNSKKWIIVESTSVAHSSDTQALSCTFAKDVLYVRTECDIVVLIDEYCQHANADEIVAFKSGPSTIAIFNEKEQGPFAVVDTGILVHGITMDSKNICIWSDEEIHVYKSDGYSQCKLHSEISLKVQSVAIYEDSLYLAKDLSLIVTDMSGIQRLTISIPSKEGPILHLDASCDQLAIITRLGIVKTMDITKKEPKLLTAGKCILQNFDENLDRILSIRCNADGSILSLLSESCRGMRQLHFYDTKTGIVKELEAIIGNGFVVISHCWDPAFTKLFACEIRSRDGIVNRILTLFLSENLDIYVHEDIQVDSFSRLMSINAPSELLLSKRDKKSSSPKHSTSYEVLHKRMIHGLEDVGVSSTDLLSALVDFTFYLTTNDLNKAYLCIQSTDNITAWNKLAQACVLGNRLDVAERCLLKMGNGLGVAAVRAADKEVALAEVAIQLGMMNDAERIYRECNRIDLLCHLYRRQGCWKEAFDTSHEGGLDQRALNFQYEKSFEFNGNQDELVLNYTKSLTSKKAILKEITLKREPVEPFLQQENDMELLKWYASYIESTGDLDMSKRLYKMANDDLSLIRIACLKGDLNDAFALVRETKSPVGAYHLARHLEATGEIEEAISCFSRCGKYNYAIRLSKAHGIDREIVNFAMQSENPQAIECAYFLESIGQQERAAELYLKAGENRKALDIIIELPFEQNSVRLNADIRSIIDGLENETSKDIINKCAMLLLRSGSDKNAIQLLQQKGHDIDDILRFYNENKIILTEKIIDIILSQYKERTDKTHLRSIAAICRAQGNHVLACRKFTQGGDRSSAMKCLLLTGDTKSIISYAFTSRTKEIYIIAANYLQTL